MGWRSESGKVTERKKFFICFLLLWVVQMAAAFYFCTQKQGFHEDEYYTYYSTARTNGFYVEDGQWMDRETCRNEFVVLPDQRFQYGLVRLVQSWDVHPPMYYWVFHTVASLVPNVFSKWIGLSVNLFFHGINIILLTCLSYLVGGCDGKLALFVTLFFGLSPAAMSGVVFIRMYEMLTTFVLLCALLHVRAVERNEAKLSVVRCLLPMAAVTYIGFLTQYYFFIFLFYLAIAFGAWLLWRDRNLWNCVRYGVSQGIAFVLAWLTYPSCLGQMFRGQRGAQATENFFDLSNTFSRIRFFWDLLNRYVFGHLLSVFLFVIVLLAVMVHQRRKRVMPVGAEDSAQNVTGHFGQAGGKFGVSYWILLFAATGYFLTVSKTALLLGETSNRYQLPVYGIIVLLIFVAVRTLWKRAVAVFSMKNRKRTETVAVVFCLVVIAIGWWAENVVFLYPEDKEQTAYAAEHAAEGVPAVYLYQPGEEWCIWDVTNELLAYPEVYFAAAEGDGVITDPKIREPDSLVVYVAEGADAEAQLERIFQSNSKLAEYERMFEEKYCDVYFFH